MDFVYICKTGANEELRYSIRSVLHNFPEARIWVVGGKPDWYVGNFIEVEDMGSKFVNIDRCYKEILFNDQISNSFILMNDDFFILKSDISYNYYDQLLNEKIKSHCQLYGNSPYARALSGAEKELKKIGIDQPLNYDVHTPMAFEKDKLSMVVDLSLAPRSMYGNIFINNGINIQDVKIYKRQKNIDLNGSIISTEDNSFSLISNQLKVLFPNKTFCEK